MMSVTLVTVFLFTSSCISFSVCEFHTMDAQPGVDVMLLCSNFTDVPIHIGWFRLNKTSSVRQISSMLTAGRNASLFGEFQHGRHEMTSNCSHLFLKIRQVDSSDSGLYFCGFNKNNTTVIVSATSFKVQGAFDGLSSPMILILGALVVLLTIVILTLVVIIRKRPAAHKEEQNPPLHKNVGSDDVTYAAVQFHAKANSRKRSATENNQQTIVLYDATAESSNSQCVDLKPDAAF
ncbi:uncharacterized protein LOC121504976 [Cheilinus undulatus]|uniref:uncharacterized protein LOC121504976 n=1 Tax=Cheilinus undulatus TaxID=241271 RepID=UPI001BD33770|nr:uncharacterized protein LOC121504976 [Cheilinus undulatus]